MKHFIHFSTVMVSLSIPLSCTAGEDGMKVHRAENDAFVEILDSGKPVLRYNFRTVLVPEGVKGKYAVARSDYIHPLYGPKGETLTKDFSKDHPHHRGLYWAWPEVYYKGDKRDLHALQGVFARPDKIIKAEGNTIVASSKWMWGDREHIVSETATITAQPKDAGGGRVIDLKFVFTAVVDGVELARRGQKAYGGFNLRFSARKEQKLAPHTDGAGAKPRRSWAQIVGVPPEGKTPVSVAIIQHAGNPHYPGDWVSFPKLNWLQPTFPSKGMKHRLQKDKPLVLKFRLYINSETTPDEKLSSLWDDFNRETEK